MTPEHQRILCLSEASHRSASQRGRHVVTLYADRFWPATQRVGPTHRYPDSLSISCVFFRFRPMRVVGLSGLPTVRPSQRGRCVVTLYVSTRKSDSQSDSPTLVDSFQQKIETLDLETSFYLIIPFFFKSCLFVPSSIWLILQHFFKFGLASINSQQSPQPTRHK